MRSTIHRALAALVRHRFGITLAALVIALAGGGAALAQTGFDALTQVPVFPLPDPGITSQNLAMTQGGTTYKINPLQLGNIFQGNCSTLTAPFANELCWNTTSSPATLQAYQSGAWANFPNVTGYAPLNSPAFTGTPTAPTAATGTNTTQIATTAFVANSIRQELSGPLTLYVSTTGADGSNTCTSSGNPCATIQHAYNEALENYDVNGHVVTIQLADGTYTQSTNIDSLLLGQTAQEGFVIQGDVTTPANVIVNGVSGENTFYVTGGAAVTIQYMEVKASGSAVCLGASFGGAIYHQGMVYGGCGNADVYADIGGHNYGITGASESIVASVAAHFEAGSGGGVFACGPPTSCTLTLTGTPAFSTAFAYASDNAVDYLANMTYSGSATGTRYAVNNNATIDTGGAGCSSLPGSANGTPTNNGICD